MIERWVPMTGTRRRGARITGEGDWIESNPSGSTAGLKEEGGEDVATETRPALIEFSP